jgi:hypothetical protein
MRILSYAVLTAAGIALAAPAFAGSGVYVGAGPRGVGVGIDVDGPRHYHRDRVVRKRVYVDDGYARARCRTTIIKRDGVTKKIRRCD